jgi:hypothetical protein
LEYDVRQIMSAFSITEQVIAGLIVAALVAVVGWLLRSRQNASDESMDRVSRAVDDAVAAVEAIEKPSPVRSSFDEKAHKLLEAFYDLADGDPAAFLASQDAADKAGIPHTAQDFNPLAIHLRDTGLIQEPGTVGLGLFRITPAGIREVERHR